MIELADLVFVTSNLAKVREAESVLGCPLDHRALDLDEIQSLDLELVTRRKAMSAFERLGTPVLVEDTSLELGGLGGFPGPLVRWLLASVGPAGICKVAACFDDRRATARCVVCATDGVDEVVAAGVVHGVVPFSPRGRHGFGWDPAFMPDGGGGRTFAEMTAADKNALSHRRRALTALADALRET